MRDRQPPGPERESTLRRLASDEAKRPFDLSRGPLIRAVLVRISEEDYVLLLTLHHIAADGWSIGILLSELTTLYNGVVSGRPASLPELPIDYGDFVEWQRARLADPDVLAPLIEFWKSRLEGELAPLDLPVDRPRPPVETSAGAHLGFTVPPDVSARLARLAADEGVTPFVLLLSAFQLLLARHTGQEEISVGTPVSNRGRREIEGLIGLFVNTLVVRTAPGNLTFRRLLKRVHETVVEAEAHQELPFEMLVDELKVRRDASRTPLFQAAFTFDRDPVCDIRIPGTRFSLLEIENDTAKFELALFMQETATCLGGVFEYKTDLFERSTIERLVEHWQILLRAIALDPDRRAAELPVTSTEERARILSTFNATRSPYPQDTVHQLFAAQARRRPHAVAVAFRGERLSYAGLNRRASQLARYLRRHGVGTESLVGLAMERSLDLVVGTLAILKAGGAYVPLDPGYPADRLAFMVRETRASVVLTRRESAAGLPNGQTRIICLDEAWPEIEQESAEELPDLTTPDHLAYVMYTSGSTGTPKASLIPHRALVRLLFGVDYVRLDEREVLLQAGSTSFDASTFEIWGALLHGGCLVLLPGRTPTPFELGATIEREKVTTLFLTTSLFNAIIDEAPQVLKPLRQLLTGGETGSAAHFVRALEALPQTSLINVYGPTETTTFATTFSAGRAGWNTSAPVPIGKPIGNTQVYILDRRLEPVPLGSAGEIFIGGDGLARGYLNRTELTAERFVPNPHGSSGSRLYRTGDYARYLPDGCIQFLGRMDGQIKQRGHRIELGEIEFSLRGHPDVRDAAVTVIGATSSVSRLIAYFVPENGAAPSADQMRAFLAQRLPEYMVPQAFVSLPALPLTPNGKLDRKALPAPDAAPSTVYMAPRTPLEDRLAGMWAELLKIERVGVYDNFFELGGNSIQAAILVNRLQEKFQATAHVRSLFMAPTVAELAAYLCEYYPEAVTRLTGGVSGGGEYRFQRQLATGDRVGDAEIAHLQRIVQPLAPYPDPTPRNPQAAFVLSPPRSGSTLLRAMLAGHSRLFSPPELDLLSFNTLAERRDTFSGKYSFWLEGPIRAIMEIQGCSAEQAAARMADFENAGLSSKAFYRQMQQWIGDRLLVDKTPVYPLDLEILRRAEHDFENTLYIHLTRHPYASIYSFVEAKLDGVFFRYPHPFTPRELAELVWVVSHRNILEFLAGIPPERQYRITYEDLVSQPRDVMMGICDFLRLDFVPEMLKPYEGRRMTDGVRPGAQMVGDFKFYLRKNIDSKAAERWRKFHQEDFLGDASWSLAEVLGYPREQENETSAAPSPPSPVTCIPRDSSLPLSFAQQRLWLLDQLEPGCAMYNVPAAVRLAGELDVAILRRSCSEIVRRHEVLRTRFQAVEGRPLQVVDANVSLDIPLIDLSSLEAGERESEVQRRAAAESRQPFDLTRGPLMRGCLFRLGPAEHIAVLVLHHIVADGWSTGVLIRELATLYEAFAAGKPSPLPELSVQYADFAAWQRTSLSNEMVEQELAYWRGQLAGSNGRIALPLDHPRPPVQTWNGRTLWFPIPKPLTENLRALSRRENATLFMTLLAAFQLLLSRYSGQPDVSVGTPVANRNRTEIEPLIGFFVNTLVLRSKLDPSWSFRRLLESVRETVTGAFAHQDVPFERLVEQLEPNRDLSTTPLFEVMFAFQNTPFKPLELPGLRVNRVEIDTGTAKFDLLLTISDRPDELKATLEFNTDLFDQATAERIVAHYLNVLEAITASPDVRISSVDFLTPLEERRLLRDWNAVSAVSLSDDCFNQSFERQAATTPDATAVTSQGVMLSYRQLNNRANQLACHLRRLGVEPESVVGILVERSVDTVLSVVATLKAGGAYLPLDPGYPPERLAYVLEDAKAPVLLAHSHLLDRVRDYRGRVVCLDRDWPAIAHNPETNPPNLAAPENLAYVIYTSGSTGRPKGVMVRHRAVMNLFAALQQAVYCRNRSGLRVSLNAPLSFDASVQQLVMLLRGDTLDVIPEEVRRDGDLLLEYIRRNRLDGLDCVPSQLKLLIDAGLLDGLSHGPSVVLPGGEAIDEQTWQVLARSRSTGFFNVYGPTECTVDSTCCEAREHPAGPSIGRPLANARVYVLDSNQELVPVGVAGELYIGGAGLARGYLNRPDLTAERFIPDRFGQEAGARLYRTGDVVRYLPGGNLEFLGRVDQQVKLRGFRIELGEIEAVLKQHISVRDCVVLVREDTPGDKRLVAYLVPFDPPPALTELRAWLRERLPEYMVPSAIVTLPALPLTPNAKVDRRALPAPAGERPELEVSYVAPNSDVEEALTGIWRKVLGIETVGIHDNFFELGGDSILSIQVVAKAREAGFALTPKQLFQNPTVAKLAALGAPAQAVRAEQGAVEGPLPATPIQRWFLEQGFAAPHHWNQSVLLKVMQPLDPGRLRAAVSRLVAHHDALRLRLGDSGLRNAPPTGDVPVEWVDFSALPDLQQSAALEQKLAQLQASLDLREGPIIRVAYFDLGPGSPARLFIVVHHLAVDGVSWRILLEDFQRAYEGQRLPAKTTSFRQWAERLSNWAHSPEVQQDFDFWIGLKSAPSNLPLDRQGENSEGSVDRVSLALSADETEVLLRTVPAVFATEINDALLAALALAVRDWTGNDAVLVDMEGHGREPVLDDVDLSRTVGWFTSMYPVELEIGGIRTASRALQAVKAQLRRVPHRGLGWGVLRYLNGHDAAGQLRAVPQPQISFNYLGQFDALFSADSTFQPAAEPPGPVHSPAALRPHLIDVTGGVSGGCLRMDWLYSRNLHARHSLEHLAAAFMARLREVIQSASREVAADPDLSDADLDALMKELG